jgi:hypothetical protein
MTRTDDLIHSLEAALLRLQSACLALDLATASHSHRLTRCRQLAGDARALLEEATDDSLS